MQVIDFAFVAHRTASRLRLRVPSRRGDDAYFSALERTLSQCDHVVSAQGNALTGSIVIRHTCHFDLSPVGFARFGLACSMPAPATKVGKQKFSAKHVKVIGIGFQVILAAMGRQPMQIGRILGELCLVLMFQQLSRPQADAALPSSK
jgi:hypothetical protein